MDKMHGFTTPDEKELQASWPQNKGYHDTYTTAPPPPPYHQTQLQPAYAKEDSQSLSQAPARATATSAAHYPAQAHHKQAPTRTLHVGYTSWKGSTIHVQDETRTQTLYLIKTHWRKPHLELFSQPSNTLIGSSTYHLLTCKIDITLPSSPSTPITLKPTGFLGRKGHSYISPALGGQTMTWKYRKGGFDLPCVDENGVTIAVFHFQAWSMQGRFELVGPVANDGGRVMEEVLVTGLAFAQFVMAMYQSGIAGSASSSAAAVSVC